MHIYVFHSCFPNLSFFELSDSFCCIWDWAEYIWMKWLHLNHGVYHIITAKELGNFEEFHSGISAI